MVTNGANKAKMAAAEMNLEEFPEAKSGPIEHDLALYSVNERLNTFKDSHWPFDSGPCIPLKMAEAGFYYTGSESSPDAVCCVVCQHELDGWEEGDCPLAEHRRHSPTCPFLKVKDPSHLTVREVIKLERKALQLIIKKAAQQLSTYNEQIGQYCLEQFENLQDT